MFLDGLVPAPSWLNAGDTGWQLTAATFVGLQSIPGLAILYAGLMKRKWALNSALMVLYAFAMTLLVWMTLVYPVGAFMIWGGGWLSQLGAVDYSGGYVIHVAAGISGVVAAVVVGPRLLKDRQENSPSNLLIAIAGGGLLWLGWNGFNGGDPYFANADSAAAVLNTNIASGTALLVWMLLDVFTTGKSNVGGMINGMIAGLV